MSGRFYSDFVLATFLGLLLGRVGISQTGISQTSISQTDSVTTESETTNAVSVAQSVDFLKYGEPIHLCKLENKKINESSGIAISRRHADLFWTHNDSGDKPRLFCFDLQGRHRGTCQLKKVKAKDWEDMCSFRVGGNAKLLIGDIGDNAAKRRSCRLYLIDEPLKPSDDLKKNKQSASPPIQTIELTYSTKKSMDCEAIGVDVSNEKLLLVEKRRWIHCRVFEADFPLDPKTGRLDVTRLPGAKTDRKAKLVAKPIAQIKLALVSAMDVSPDGRRAIVMTLGEAVEFIRTGDESWSDAFKRKPKIVHLPPRRQGEAVCYGANGRDLYLTSEMTPTPLFKVPAE